MLAAILFYINRNLMLLFDRSSIDLHELELAQITGMETIVASENTATIALVLVA
ncbi:MAG: hypothetical protein HC894_06330, partial [Microcoleus sp. SM1_3_4]|nr:hypothetical protein [Microcoleus sp. SM1_3_4]